MRRLLLLATFLPAAGLHADDTAPPRWQGTVDASYTGSMGSASGSKEAFRAKLALTRHGAYWINTVTLEGHGLRDDIAASNDPERYLASFKARHFFNARDFFTLRLQGEKDLLSRYDSQAFASLGLGRDVINTDTRQVKLEAGPGLRHSEARQGEDRNNPMGLFSWDVMQKLGEALRLVQKGSVEAGEDNVVTRVATQLKHQFNPAMALTVNHDYKHDHGPVSTREGVVSVGLNYQFK